MMEIGLDLEPYPAEMDTMAGLVLTRLDRMAKRGDVVSSPTHDIKVVHVDGLRIVTLLVSEKPPPASGAEGSSR